MELGVELKFVGSGMLLQVPWRERLKEEKASEELGSALRWQTEPTLNFSLVTPPLTLGFSHLNEGVEAPCPRNCERLLGRRSE